MKRYLIILSVAAMMSPGLKAQNNGVSVENVKMDRNGKYLTVGMDMNLSGLEVESNRAVLLTPCIVNKGDSLDLPAVGIYGRRRYYHYQRNYGDIMISGENETTLRASKMPDVQPYETIVNYEGWMDNSQLIVKREDYGCCSDILYESMLAVGEFHDVPLMPALVYVRPVAEVKDRSISGFAFVDFPVNKTDIRPDYRGNTAELNKIIATIDSVKNDADMRITTVSIKGYASPEGSYANNERLARGRTEALKQYVRNLYHFSDDFIHTAYEPEDWDGLRAYVEKSGLQHKNEILDIINSYLEPDAKDNKIKATYPDEYRFLLANCYPALRHSDYKVEYTIRSFTDVEEIKRIMATQPQKLSLEEFYRVAQTMEPGSHEFTEVFETAVRMYPNDASANLNAANTAMKRNDLNAAKRYLDKAGDSPEADYARGVYAYLNKDYATAKTYYTKAKEAGIAEAAEQLSIMEKNL